MASSFTKTKVKLDLLTDIDILLIIKKGIRGWICNSIYQYAKANNKYMKDYDQNKESSCLQYWDVNNLYGWAMLQKLPIKNIKWVKDILKAKFEESFVKSYNEESDKGFIFKLMFNILKNCIPSQWFIIFTWRMKIEKVESLWLIGA